MKQLDVIELIIENRLKSGKIAAVMEQFYIQQALHPDPAHGSKE